MNQHLSTTTQPASPSLTADPATAYAIGRYHRLVSYRSGRPTMEGAIPKADKDAIEGRLAEVNRTLLPMRGMTNREEIGAALARMFSGFTNTKSPDPQTTIATYLVKLAELPAWAIDAAIYDIERGRADGLSPDFPPSAARVPN